MTCTEKSQLKSLQQDNLPTQNQNISFFLFSFYVRKGTLLSKLFNSDEFKIIKFNKMMSYSAKIVGILKQSKSLNQKKYHYHIAFWDQSFFLISTATTASALSFCI